jgi:hypothetical protein
MLQVSENFVLEAHKAACPEWKQKIEKQFPGLFTHKVGNRYEYGNDVYLLVRIASDANYDWVNLIDMKTGNRWCDHVRVKTHTCISEQEFNNGFNPCRDIDFKLIHRNCDK